MKILTIPSRLGDTPDFLNGMARVLDMGSTLDFRKDSFDGDADFLALKGDWERVGMSIREVMEDFEDA